MLQWGMAWQLHRQDSPASAGTGTTFEIKQSNILVCHAGLRIADHQLLVTGMCPFIISGAAFASRNTGGSSTCLSVALGSSPASSPLVRSGRPQDQEIRWKCQRPACLRSLVHLQLVQDCQIVLHRCLPQSASCHPAYLALRNPWLQPDRVMSQPAQVQ